MNDVKKKVIDMYLATLSLKKFYQTKQVTAITNYNKLNPTDEITFKTILGVTHPKLINHIPPQVYLDKYLPYGIGELLYSFYSAGQSVYDAVNSSYKTTNFFTFASLDPLQKNIPIYRFGGFEQSGHSVILYLQGFDGKERRLTLHMNTFLADFREVL